MNDSSLIHDDLRNKISPFLLTLCNAANEIADPVYFFIDPKREQAATLGRLVLRLGARIGNPLQVSPESRLLIYIPRELLSLADVRAIQLDAASALHWTMELPAENDVPVTLTPRSSFTITDQQTQTIVFTLVLATSGEPVQRRSITFAWEKFGGLEDDSRNCNATRELPPGATDEKANLDVQWRPRTEYYEAADTVYITPYSIGQGTPGIANRLILRLGNKEEGQLEKGQAKFTVTFPTTRNGDSLSALFTPEQLSRVQCVQHGQFHHRWQIEPMMSGEVPHWVLSPPADSTTVFGQDTYVSFEFSNLVTEMMVAPCAAVVGWSGIKGRKSGALRVAIEKTLPRPAVIEFNARSGAREVRHLDPVDFKEPITLDWRLFAADACRVDELQEGSLLQTGLTLRPGDTKVVLPTRAGVAYVLTPQISLQGTVHRGTSVDKEFVINPATATLRADPDELVPSNHEEPDTCPIRTTLYWNCTSGDCFLVGPGLMRHEVQRTGHIEVIAGVSEYRVECIGTATAAATVKVKLPAPFVKFRVEPCPGKVFRLTWSSKYVTDVEVRAPSNSWPVTVSRDLSGSVDVNGTVADISANGAGRFTAKITVGKDATNYPELSTIAYYRGSRPVIFISYKNARSCMMRHGVGSAESAPILQGDASWSEWTLRNDRPAGTVEVTGGRPSQLVVMTLEIIR